MKIAMKSTMARVYDKKKDALQYFLNYLKDSNVKRYLAKVILFGSVAQGRADKESDIDVLVFTTGKPEKITETCAEAAMWTGIEMEESVEPLVRSVHRLYNGQSYFLRKALSEGEVVYSMADNELAHQGAQSFHYLSQEFSDVANYNFKGGYFRGAVDSAYNAIELSIKGLLVLKMNELPKTHGGLVRKVGELYVKPGLISKEIGRDINKALQVRNDARYDPYVTIDKGKAQELIKLSKILLEVLENKLSEDK